MPVVASFYVEAAHFPPHRVTVTILLVRHGSHAEVGRILSGRSDIALSDAGRHEVARLAARLAAQPIAAVQCGPSRRTRETAALLAAPHALAVEPVEALDEIDFGRWTGESFATLAGDPAWRRWNAARATTATPAGDTMERVVARATAHLEALAGDRPILCVSHCDVIRGVVARYLGMDYDRMLGFDCDPASLTTVTLDHGTARIVALNERAA